VRRQAVERLVREHQMSERRACRLVGLSRDAYRHPPKPSAQDQALSESIKTIAHKRRRFGYRRVHDLLQRTHPGVNHKRVYRLYRQANLAVRKRRKGRRPNNERVPLVAATRVNQTWSMDFVSDSLCNGRRLKLLTVADDFSHECVTIAVDFGIGGEYVTRLLDEAARFRGYPQAIRTDNGPEFVSRAFLGWLQRHRIEHILIQPGRPMQNGYIESFNGKFRDECLNEHWFETLLQARQIVRVWVLDYNEVRPHSSLGRIPPRRFAHLHRRQAGDTGFNPTGNNEYPSPWTPSE
jgi:putative transposase